MGPRSDERGNSTWGVLVHLHATLLQWGRAQMSAEICCAAHALNKATCFNGAALR